MSSKIDVKTGAERSGANSDNRQRPEAFSIHILTTQDEEGGYSTIALNLPGAGSCGRTEEAAVENAKEAIRGAIESYKEAGEEIPWYDSSNEEIPFGAKQKWIIVNV